MDVSVSMRRFFSASHTSTTHSSLPSAAVNRFSISTVPLSSVQMRSGAEMISGMRA